MFRPSFTVTTLMDVVNPNDGVTSLREAIQEANSTEAHDDIRFFGGGKITMADAVLPAITKPVSIVTSKAGEPAVDLDGNGKTGNGFEVAVGGVEISGFAISNFNGNGIVIQNPAGSAGCRVHGCIIGSPLSPNSGHGVKILGPDNVIGTTGSTFTDATSRNFIRYNGGSGIWIAGANALGNVVKNNEIYSNGEKGVYISGGANSNTIGGAIETQGQVTRAANVLSGNVQNGVRISGSHQNKVYGNYIGLAGDGTTVLGNVQSGIRLDTGTTGTAIGKAGGFGNVISGNQQMGVLVWGMTTTGNKIVANKIGTDALGINRKDNLSDGIRIEDAGNTTIGGAAAGDRNQISGNGGNGVYIFGVGAIQNVIRGNYIGTDDIGQNAVKNNLAGVLIQSSQNTVGGSAVGEGNLISGNGQNGIELGELRDFQGQLVSAANLNVIAGNRIGTNEGGTVALKNDRNGVVIQGDNNTVGAAGADGRNIISGNGQNGVRITGGTTNTLVNNYIGTNQAGDGKVANVESGVVLAGGTNTTIGGADAADTRNVISGNGVAAGVGYGILILTGVNNTTIQGNFIGTKANGTDALSNKLDGVFVSISTSGTLIGGPGAGAGNVISGNDRYGLSINSAATTIQKNRIGYKAGEGLTEADTQRNKGIMMDWVQVDPTGNLGTWTDNQTAPPPPPP